MIATVTRTASKSLCGEGGWCWFQDPRAIVRGDHLLMGSVQGNGGGAALVGVYDLVGRKSLGSVVLNPNFGRDDHNSPVFYLRPDGRVLAVYALHGKEKVHYYRVSDRESPLNWGEERTYEHDYPTAGTVTYMNLYALPAEGRLYNFFRGIGYNPSFITSQDEGETWGEPTHLIKSELPGRHRPYARYTSNGIDSVHVSFTDGHPDRYGNNIYYAAFRDGKFLRADGTTIKDLQSGRAAPPQRGRTGLQGRRRLGSGRTGQCRP